MVNIKSSKGLSWLVKYRTRILTISIVAILAFFVLTRGSLDEDKIKATKVFKKPLTVEVSASGKVTWEKTSVVRSAVSGKIIWVGVGEGDYVVRGQTIAVLDREKYEIALRQAEQDVVAADAELVKVYDDLSKGDSVETFDEKIKRTAAEAKKNKAYDFLKLAERNLKDAVITAPIAGKVVALGVNAGEEILQTVEIAKIAESDRLEFIAEVDEVDIAQVRQGQYVSVTLEAFSDKKFDSQIKSIDSESITSSSGATAFEVKMDFKSIDDLRSGMSGDARIEISKIEDTLVVPLEALVDENYIYIQSDKDITKKEVEVGLVTDTESQIVSGASEGDKIIIAGFDEIGKKSLLSKILEIIFKRPR